MFDASTVGLLLALALVAGIGIGAGFVLDHLPGKRPPSAPPDVE